MKKRRLKLKLKINKVYEKRNYYIPVEEITKDNEHKLYLSSEEEEEVPFKIEERIKLIDLEKKRKTGDEVNRQDNRSKSLDIRSKSVDIADPHFVTHLSRNRNVETYMKRNPKENILKPGLKFLPVNGYIINGVKVTRALKISNDFKRMLKGIATDLKLIPRLFILISKAQAKIESLERTPKFINVIKMM